MLKQLLATLLGLGIGASAMAQAPVALDDAELANVSGGDGISLAVRLNLNDPTLPNPVIDSRISMGFNVDGRDTYIVIRNPRGRIDMFGIKLDVEKKPDGADYLAIGLPAHVGYSNWGFESISAQTDPNAPVTESLGRFNMNGTLNFQGQVRMWAH